MEKNTGLSALKFLAYFTIMLILGGNIYFLHHYIKVHKADPLENIQVEIVSPISISAQDPVVASGKYDRDIRCQLTDFDLQLTSMTSNIELTVGPESLLKVPPANKKPGKDIPIEFAVAQHKDLTPGLWKPEFQGFYLCNSSLFMQDRIVRVQLSVIKVVE